MRAKNFETSPEKRVRRVLSLAVEGTRYWANSQTPIESLLMADEDDSPEERSMIRNGTFDFTIHRESSQTAAWAVEYDGPTHDEPDQARRDLVKNRICGKMNLPLLRIGHREDDDFLTAIERVAALEWLVRRWIAYESEIGDLIRQSDQRGAQLPADERTMLTFEEVSPEFHFDVEHPYPPLRAIADRLRDRYAIDVELPWRDHDEASAAIKWHVATPSGIDLFPDVGGFHVGYDCEVEVRPADEATGHAVFLSSGSFETRFAYPVRPGQRDALAFDPESVVLSGPPWGGSPARIGGEIAWYRALKQVEHWAERNFATLRTSCQA